MHTSSPPNKKRYPPTARSIARSVDAVCEKYQDSASAPPALPPSQIFSNQEGEEEEGGERGEEEGAGGFSVLEHHSQGRMRTEQQQRERDFS